MIQSLYTTGMKRVYTLGWIPVQHILHPMNNDDVYGD